MFAEENEYAVFLLGNSSWVNTSRSMKLSEKRFRSHLGLSSFLHITPLTDDGHLISSKCNFIVRERKDNNDKLIELQSHLLSFESHFK